MTIALIDDHELIAKAITYMLQKDPGITEVKTFTTVPLFLESLDGSWKPDIIITDLLLPVMGGMELIAKIRKMPEFNSTRIIVLSSITDVHTIRHTFKIGANGYLSKDSSLEELTDAIQAVTEAHRGAGAAAPPRGARRPCAGDAVPGLGCGGVYQRRGARRQRRPGNM